MIRLDAATFLLQWATGGLFFLWVTTRRREVGIGYGWLLRGIYLLMAVGAVFAGRIGHGVAVRDVASVATAVAAAFALAVSIVHRKAGVRGEHERAERVAARLGAGTTERPSGVSMPNDGTQTPPGREFPPVVDLFAPAIGLVGIIAGAWSAGGPHPLAIVRFVAGAAFLGAVTDAMLLGHWYLVQPGLGRAPLHELNRYVAWTWPFEVGALLWPTGMVSVFTGKVDDGWGGQLGWFWIACAATTLILTFVTRAALKERAYSAVMAATGLLYLAILTAFGTDLVARAVLGG
jgi:hypothetical protein